MAPPDLQKYSAGLSQKQPVLLQKFTITQSDTAAYPICHIDGPYICICSDFHGICLSGFKKGISLVAGSAFDKFCIMKNTIRMNMLVE